MLDTAGTVVVRSTFVTTEPLLYCEWMMVESKACDASLQLHNYKLHIYIHDVYIHNEQLTLSATNTHQIPPFLQVGLRHILEICEEHRTFPEPFGIVPHPLFRVILGFMICDAF